jgi:hypothetical protein
VSKKRPRRPAPPAAPPPTPPTPPAGRDWAFVLAVAGAVIAALIAVLPARADFWGHDLAWHAARIAEWHRAVGDGVLVPRFLPDVYWGHGGPVMAFTPPFPYLVTEGLNLLGAGPIRALGLAMALALAGGAAALYALTRGLLGRAGAAVAAAAYALAPYRLLDAWVRAAYPELVATAILPVLLLCARRAAERRSPGAVAALAAAVAAVALTHAPSTVIGLPLAVAYGVLYLPAGTRRAALLALAGGFGLGVGLAAFYVVPAYLEQDATSFARWQTIYHWGKHFTSLGALVQPRWGYGGDGTGADAMSLQIGWVHLCALLGGVGLAWRAAPALRREARFWLGAVAIAIFLVLPASRLVWDTVPLLSSILFPWRLLVVPALAASLLLGALVSLAAGHARLAAAGGAVLLCCVAYAGYAKAPPPRETDADFTPAALARGQGADAMWIPRAARRSPPPGPRVELTRGAGHAEVLADRTHHLRASVETEEPAPLHVRIFAFPGWRARIDGAATAWRTDPESGDILVDVPAGRHEVRLDFGATPTRRAGELVSLLALVLGAAGLLVWRRRRQR